MSRVYTIKVAERVRRVVHLEDSVKTKLELLDVLPPEGMSGVLARELERRGFTIEDGKAVRIEDDGIVIEVDLESAEVTVGLARETEIEKDDISRGRSTAPRDKKLEKKLKDQLRDRLEDEVDREREEQQDELTKQLEQALADIQAELDQIGNRVTADALKEKAASMGEVTSVEEDEQTGSVTIKVKV